MARAAKAVRISSSSPENDVSCFSTGFSAWIQELKSELNDISDDIASKTIVPSLQDICIQQLMPCKVHRDSLMPLYAQIKPVASSAKLEDLKRKLKVEIIDFYQYFRDNNHVDYIKECIGNEFYEKCEDVLAERLRIKKTMVVSTSSGQIIERELYRQTSNETKTAEQHGIYPYEALKQGRLWPDHVDVTKREQYLSDTEFESIFNMTKAAFEKLDKHKRKQLKQEVHLF